MSRAKIILSMMAMAMLVMAVGVPLVAQDATATPADNTGTTGGTGTMTNCDSTLILLAGIAERYFGYTGAPDLDISTFEHGQFTPLFDMSGMGGMQPGEMATVEPMATSDAGMATMEPAATMEAMATPMMSSVMLNPPVITDENASCGQLRASLEAFFATKMADPNWDANFRSGMNSSNG